MSPEPLMWVLSVIVCDTHLETEETRVSTAGRFQSIEVMLYSNGDHYNRKLCHPSSVFQSVCMIKKVWDSAVFVVGLSYVLASLKVLASECRANSFVSFSALHTLYSEALPNTIPSFYWILPVCVWLKPKELNVTHNSTGGYSFMVHHSVACMKLC